MEREVRHKKATSKYEFIKNQILADIAEGVYQTGDKIPSESELCEEYGASRITVRKALDELTAMDVLEKLQGVGAFIKERKSEGNSGNTVIVIVPYIITQLSNSIWAEMMRGIEDVFRDEKVLFFEMLEPNFESGKERFLKTLKELSPLGIIYLFYYGLDIQSELVKLNCPVVFVDMEPEDNMFDLVKGDDYQSAYHAAWLMLESGKKNIGFFGQPNNAYSTLRERESGVRNAILDFGANLNESSFYHKPKPSQIRSHSSVFYEDGIEIGLQYLSQNHLDGVITFNDSAARVILEAGGSLGIRIPGDLAIISYGNYYEPYKHHLYTNMSCSVTSYEQSFYEYGRMAAELVVKRLRGEVPGVQQKRIIPYQLIRKASF